MQQNSMTSAEICQRPRLRACALQGFAHSEALWSTIASGFAKQDAREARAISFWLEPVLQMLFTFARHYLC